MHIIQLCGAATTACNLLHGGEASIDALALRELVVSGQYSLLSVSLRCSLAPPFFNSAIPELFRTGLLLYLVSLTIEYPTGTAATLIQKIISLLPHISVGDDSLNRFRLWLLFLSGSMTGTDHGKKMIASLLGEAIFSSNTCGWDDCRAVLHSFYWVEKIHGAQWFALWDLVKNLTARGGT